MNPLVNGQTTPPCESFPTVLTLERLLASMNSEMCFQNAHMPKPGFEMKLWGCRVLWHFNLSINFESRPELFVANFALVRFLASMNPAVNN